jgi:hypothetical protein
MCYSKIFCRISFFAAFRNMFNIGTYLIWTSTYTLCTKYCLNVLYKLKTYRVHTVYWLFNRYYSPVHHVYVQIQNDLKKLHGVENRTVCLMHNARLLSSYLRRYKSSKIFTWSHLVAGVKRPAAALRHAVQSCRRRGRAVQPFGFRGSLDWH